MVVGERTARHQRGDDVDAGELGELADGVGGPRFEHATADVQHGPLGLEDQSGGLLDHPRVALGGRPVPGQRRHDFVVGRPVPLHRLLQHVLRHVDEDGPWAAGGGQVERLADRERHVLGRHHQLVVLGRRAGDPDGVALLEGVTADGVGRHLSRDRHHRDRVHVGVHQRSDEVRRRRSRRHHRHPRPAGDVGVALGHVSRALLVTHENVPDRRLEQRVVRGQDAAPGQPEDDFHRLLLEALDERLRSGELSGCHDGSFGQSVKSSGKSNRPPGWEVEGHTRRAGPVCYRMSTRFTCA